MKGLTSALAADLLKKHGANELLEVKGPNIFVRFLAQFNNFFIALLFIAFAFSYVMGEKTDAYLILTIVLLNAFFGVYQEKKAEEAVALLKKITTMLVRVIRDGKEQEIDSRSLVPGDIVRIEDGGKIPADARIIKSAGLELNESSLTGESLPVPKQNGDEVFMGTIVARGHGFIEITQTGMRTKFGSIAAQLTSIKKVKTPLQRKLTGLSRVIGVVGLALSIFVFFLASAQGLAPHLSFLLAVSLAVAVVPEGLPAVMTMTLAIGVREMAKRRAIIRNLPSIEALGSVTLIATDKTGTLTTNEMRVKEVFVGEKIYHLSREKPHLTNTVFKHVLLNSILCSTASLVYAHEENRYDILGDPTEGALLYMAHDFNMSSHDIRKEWEVVEEKPFDAVSKTMSVRVRKGKEEIVYKKGAPESILQIVTLTSTEKNKIEKIMNKWAQQGFRMLAFSMNKGKKEEFLGMVAIFDPPRPEVKSALEKTKNAGIKVVMVTGDNEKTAEAIAASVGLLQKGDEILTGAQLDQYTDEKLLRILPRIRVFARISPFHKERIVSLYQSQGEIVAMTGDGVNDAIALKRADVGIAMGKAGTDVARETADMVITDDNFASIVNAVEEGRHIVRNLKNTVTYLLAGNFSEALALILGLFVGLPSFLIPIQILYINLISDGAPALALAFSPRDDSIMRTPPQKTLTLLDGFRKRFILLVGSLGAIIVLCSYYLFAGQSEILGRTAAFSVLALVQSYIFVDLWLSHKSALVHRREFKNPIFYLAFLTPFLLQFIILTSPHISRIFHIQTVSPMIYSQFVLLGALVLLGTALIKKFR